MNTQNHKHEEEKRYLKKFEIVETEVELPIQGQVRDTEDLYKFLKDLTCLVFTGATNFLFSA